MAVPQTSGRVQTSTTSRSISSAKRKPDGQGNPNLSYSTRLVHGPVVLHQVVVPLANEYLRCGRASKVENTGAYVVIGELEDDIRLDREQACAWQGGGVVDLG